MSSGIRGQEVYVKLSVDGEPQSGSFLKVEDFEVTQRTDLVERDFAGERASDLDSITHGYDVSFTIEEQDHRVIDLVRDIANRDNEGLPPAIVNLTVLYQFREPGAQPRTEVYRQGVVKIDRRGFQSRKDYVKASIQAKFKKLDVINA